MAGSALRGSKAATLLMRLEFYSLMCVALGIRDGIIRLIATDKIFTESVLLECSQPE